jgi:acetylornithine deacetylase/succinyl-diaminopimelate desuccinylase-like protein
LPALIPVASLTIVQRPLGRTDPRQGEFVAMTSESAVATWEHYLATREDGHLAELFDFLGIPSVSALPVHRAEMARAAEWVAARLRAAGVSQVALLPTGPGAPPVVTGRVEAGPDRPTALIYAHYDVQPADPLELWTTPPFEPAIRDGAVYARGASDDKGMLLATIAAVEALLRTGTMPPLNLVFCFEGEEEVFSDGLEELIAADPARFACDVVVSVDGTMYGRDQLSVTVSTKGSCALEIDLQTAAQDLHSGLFGATVPNAAQAMACLLATFHDERGRVAVAGFYDDVRELTPAERAELNAAPFDAETYLQQLGATALWGEPGYTTLERAGARPTVDVVGMTSGFTDEGIKSATPCRARAKLTCRLFADQDPARILDLLERHVAAHTPPGATVTTTRFPGAYPFAIPSDHPALLAARDVLRELGGREPLTIRIGGTLPIAPTFQRELGADMVLFAWEMPDANFHAPNEFLRLDDFRTACRGYCRYLTRLAEVLRSAPPPHAG